MAGPGHPVTGTPSDGDEVGRPKVNEAPEHTPCHVGPALDEFLAATGGWADAGTRLRWPYRAMPLAEAARQRDRARAMVPELLPASRRPARLSPPYARRCARSP